MKSDQIFALLTWHVLLLLPWRRRDVDNFPVGLEGLPDAITMGCDGGAVEENHPRQ